MDIVKYRYKRFTIAVPTAATSYNQKFVLDKDVLSVRGVLVTADRTDLLYLRGSQKIEISGEEIFPEDYESQMLMTGLAVPPDDKYFTLAEGRGIPSGNGEIKILFKDAPNAALAFSVYNVTIMFACEIKQ